MAIDQIPPWLLIHPQMFTQALESGARLGLAMSEQQQRAQEAALNRAMRQSEMDQQAAMRQQAYEEKIREFEEKRQETEYEKAKETRLQQYELARIGLEKAKEEIAARHQASQDENEKFGLKLKQIQTDTALGHLKLAEEKLRKEKEPEVTFNSMDESGKTLWSARGGLSKMEPLMNQKKTGAVTHNTKTEAPGPSMASEAAQGIGNFFMHGPLFPPRSMWPGEEAPPVGTASQKSAARYRYQAGKGFVPLEGDQQPTEDQVQPER